MKIKDILKKLNITIFIISIILGVVIWTIIMNIVNPLIEEKVSIKVDINMSDEIKENDKSYTISKEDQEVYVIYKVRQDDIRRVDSRDFSCSVNIDSDIESSFIPLDLQKTESANKYAHDIKLEPDRVFVSTDDYAEKSFKVTTLQSGALPSSDLLIGYISTVPNDIIVSGPQNDIKKIDRVCINVDVSGKTDTFDNVAKPLFYDSDGLVIENLELKMNTEEVQYKVVIYGKKNLTINQAITGNVAKGFAYAGTILTPNNISISGPLYVISELSTIELPEVDITDLKENKTINIDVQSILPKNTRNASSINNIKVVITVNDMHIERRDFEEGENPEEGENIMFPVPYPPIDPMHRKVSTNSNVIIHKAKEE